jgi:putative FmdB family regulatory protein
VPLYEYHCHNCNLKFEARRPIAERQTATCPQCGLLANKVMSVVNNTFGWMYSDKSNEPFAKDELVRAI